MLQGTGPETKSNGRPYTPSSANPMTVEKYEIVCVTNYWLIASVTNSMGWTADLKAEDNPLEQLMLVDRPVAEHESFVVAGSGKWLK